MLQFINKKYIEYNEILVLVKYRNYRFEMIKYSYYFWNHIDKTS